MENTFKRFLSLVTAIVLVISMMPTTAFQVSATEVEETETVQTVTVPYCELAGTAIPEGAASISLQENVTLHVFWYEDTFGQWISFWAANAGEADAALYLDSITPTTIEPGFEKVVDQSSSTYDLADLPASVTEITVKVNEGDNVDLKLVFAEKPGDTTESEGDDATETDAIDTGAELVTAVAAGGNVVLGGDIKLTETLVVAEGNIVTLDLNGHALTIENETTTYAINNRGELTLKDSVGTGSVSARGIYNGYDANGNYVTTAKLTVESGTYNAMGTNNGGGAIFNYGVAHINGGTFTSVSSYALVNQTGSEMTVEEGVVVTGGINTWEAKLTVNGGTVSNDKSGKHVVYAGNSTLIINNGSFYNYNSGNATVFAAGTTVATINNGTFGIKDGRVEGDGSTFTSYMMDTSDSATMTINDGTYNGGFRVQAAATMTINGGSCNNVGGSGYGIYGTATVNGGTFTDSAAQKFASDNLAEGVEIDETTGKVTAPSYPEYVVLPKGVSVADFGDNTVTDGVNFYLTLKEALEGIHLTENRVLYCKPGAEVGIMTHGHVCDDLTVYGNGATISGGERDFEVDTYKFCHNSANTCSGITETLDLVVKNLNGVAVWGQRNSSHTINVTIDGCGDIDRIYISGTSGNNNITLTECTFIGNIHDCKVYSNANGSVVIDSCTFKGVNVPVNLNHKVAGVQNVEIKNSSFDSCGTAAYDYAAPVRVLSSVAGAESVVTVANTTFANTVANKQGQAADILLDYGEGTTDVAVSGTAASVVTEMTENVGTGVTVEAEETKSFANYLLKGAGTEASPYLINDLEELCILRDNVNAGTYAGKYIYVKLMADIDVDDCSDEALFPEWAWIPIGTTTNAFQGVFDGNGKTIKNLWFASSENYTGFFGQLGNNPEKSAVVKNLTLDTVAGYTLGDRSGAVAGEAFTATLTNVVVKNAVINSNGTYIGGLVGHGYVSATNCAYIGDITGQAMQVGGILGSGQVKADGCQATGSISGDTWVGGICGNGQESSAFEECYVEGTISAESDYYGASAAGIVAAPASTSQTIKNNYVNANTLCDGEQIVAPVVGGYNATLDESTDLSNLSGNSWNRDIFDVDSFQVAELGETYTVTENRNNNLVVLESDLQYVKAEDASEVTILQIEGVTQVTEDEVQAAVDAYNAPVEVDTAEELAAALADNRNVKLVADIDLTPVARSTGWVTVANYSKTLDGNGKTISGLTAPLFGTITDATIKDLTIDANISTTASDAAAIALLTGGTTTITNVTVKGTVSGGTDVTNDLSKNGGAAGFIVRAVGNLTIDNCVNEATVIGVDRKAAGFISSNGTAVSGDVITIKNSVNKGAIIANQTNTTGTSGEVYAAGFLAWNGAKGVTVTIENCTNNGTISAVRTIDGGNSVAAGGIFGTCWSNAQATTVTGAVNTGDVTATNNGTAHNAYAGGITGLTNPSSNTTVVSANVSGTVKAVVANEANTTGYAAVGGITGQTNNASSVLTVQSADVSAADLVAEGGSKQVAGAVVGNHGGNDTSLTYNAENIIASGGMLVGNDASTAYAAQLNGRAYLTLADAVKAANSDADESTIVLLSDCDFVNRDSTGTLAESKITSKVILDLNGYTVTSKFVDGTNSPVGIWIAASGDLTIQDSSEGKTGTLKADPASGGNAVCVEGKFTLNSGNIYSHNNGIYGAASTAVIVVNGGKITAEPETDNSSVMYLSGNGADVTITGGEMVGYNGILLWDNVTINMTGGSITAQKRTAIQGNGSKDNTSITISGGSVVSNSTEAAAIYHPQGGDLTISGDAVITGATGIIMKGGDLKISGGTITGTGEKTEYYPVNSGFMTTGDALMVEHYNDSTDPSNYGTPTVEITGGTFVSENATAVASYANPDTGVETVTKFISGGTYNTQLDASVLEESYKVVERADGTYGVSYITEAYIMQGGLKTFTSLAAAIEAVSEGGTVYLAGDVLLTERLNLSKDVILDLNGCKLTLAARVHLNNDAEVTIENGTLDITGAVAGGEGLICVGYHSEEASLTLSNVTMVGNGYNSAFGVFYVFNNSTLNITDSTIDLAGEQHASGGFIKSGQQDGTNGTITITDSDISLTDAGIGILNGDVTLDGVELTIQGGANAINQSKLTAIDSTITVDGADGRALTLHNGDVTLINSDLNFSNCSEGEIRFKKGLNLSVDADSTIAACDIYADSVELGATVNGNAVTGIEGNESTIENAAVTNPAWAAKIGATYYMDLADAIAAGGNVVLLKDIQLDASITNSGTVVLDLNGHTITGTDTTSTNFGLINNKGNLTVTDSVGNGKITLTATTDSDWGRYSAVISNNPGGNLTINGGHIEHLGGTDMAYGIDNLTNGKGTSAVTTVNGGTIKSTYRGIRQFLNGVEANNTLTINGGVVEGTNKSVWMQDPNKNANTGTLTIGENAEIKGDVYLFVTAGSTEWPVEVSIDADALAEGVEIVSANVPAGYDIKNVNGTYGVVEVVAAIGDETYTTLAEALAVVEDGETVTLLVDLTVGNTANAVGITRGVSFTLDLGGNTLTANTTNSAVRININNNLVTAPVEITLKNGTINAAASAYCALIAAGKDKEATLTVNVEDVKMTNCNNYGFAVKAFAYATVNLKSGTEIISTDGQGGAYATDGSVINVYEGVSITQKDSATTYMGANLGVSGTGIVNVYGGTFVSDKYNADVMSSGGTLNIYDGTFTSTSTGVQVDSWDTTIIAPSVANIYGGTFTAPKVVWVGAYDGEKYSATANITGGTFNGALDATYGGSQSNIVASGGIFDEPVADEYCADGFKPAANADGTYGVIEKTHLVIVVTPVTPMTITETVYQPTLADAIAYALANPADQVTYQLTGAETLETGFSHGIIALGENVTIEGVTEDASLTIVGGGVPDFKGVTFKNLTFADEGTYNAHANEFMYQNFIDCTFENVTFVDGVRLSGNTTMTGCTINADTSNEYAVWLDEGNFTMTDTTLVAEGDAYGMIKSDEVDTITLNGNTFKYTNIAQKEALNTNGATIVAEDNTFINCDAGIVPADKTNYAADGTTAINDAAIAADNEIKNLVATIGTTEYATLDAALAAVQDGDTIVLMADVALTESLVLNAEGTIVIEGNGHTITTASDFTDTQVAALMLGATTYGDAEAATHNYTFKNVVFDGVQNTSVIRAQGVALTMDGCTVQNYTSSKRDTVVRLDYTNATLVNSTFEGNNGGMVVVHNYNVGDAGSQTKLTIDNCAFKNNTVNLNSAVVYYVEGSGCEITDSEFVGNAVNCPLNAATLYLGFTEDNVVTGNLFQDNTVTCTGTSARVAGAIFFGYQSDVSGNAFIGNTASNANGDTLGQICTSTYYACEIDLSGNYWGGEEPAYGKDYTIQHQTGEASFALENYYEQYVAETGVLSELVETEYVAQVGKVPYTSLADALAVAKDGEIVTLLTDLTIESDVADAAKGVFNIAADDKITLDLNGKTINATDNSTGNFVLFYNYGELTVKNGTVNLTATNDRDWNAQSTIILNRGGVLNIESGTYTHNGGTDMAITVDNSANSFGDAYLNVKGGSISSTYVGVRMRMENPNGNGDPGNGIAYVNVTGGSIYGGSRGIWGQKSTSANEKMGELSVTGGTVEGGNQAINIQTDTYEAQNVVAAISGNAVIKGVLSADATELAVSGGTFSEPVDAAYCAEGFVPTKNANGTYGVVEETNIGQTYIAKVGGMYYAALQDAIDASEAGSTILVLNDITQAERFVVEKDLTIDLNGHTLYVQANKNLVCKGAELSIENGIIDISNVDLTEKTSAGIFAVGGAVTGAATVGNLNLTDVTVTGTDYGTGSNGAVFMLYGASTLDVIDCEMTLTNNNANGSVFYGSGSNCVGDVYIENSTLDFDNVVRGAVYTTMTIADSTVEITGGDNGFNGTALAIEDSVVTISGGTGRGLTLENGDMEIYNSVVTITDMGEASIRFKHDRELNISGRRSNVTIESVVIDTETLLDEVMTVARNATVTTMVAQVGDTCYASLQAAVDAAADGDTVTLLTDIALTEKLAIEKDITIDLNGLTITGADTAIALEIKANVSIENGTVEGNTSGNTNGVIKVTSGSLALDQVVLTNTYDSSIRRALRVQSGASAVLTDCTVTGFISGVGTTEIKSGTYYYAGSELGDSIDGAGIEVSGGTFHYELVESDCINGWMPKDNGDGTWTVVEKPYVAEVDGTQYKSLAEAVAAAPAGATVKLLADCTGEGMVIDSSVIIDLGGHTYTMNTSVGSANTATNGLQILNEAGAVTIMNGTLAMAEDQSGDKYTFFTMIMNYADLTLTDVTMDCTNGVVTETAGFTGLNVQDGNVTIDGATSIINSTFEGCTAIHVEDNTDYADGASLAIDTTGIINGEIATANGGEIAISGGSFSSVVDEAYCAEGFAPVTEPDENGLYTVTELPTYAAENTTTGEQYETLQAAIEAAGENDVIKLLADGETALVSKEVRIDKNGHTAHVFAGIDLTVKENDTAYMVVPASTASSNVGPEKAYVDLDGNGECNGEEVAQTLQDALNAAAALYNGTDMVTVRLLQDFVGADKIDTVIIPTGVLLDIGEYDLEATYIIGLNGSQIKNGTTGTGGSRLIVAKANLILSEGAYETGDYYVMPVWDDSVGNYAFALIQVYEGNSNHGIRYNEDGSVSYQFNYVSNGTVKDLFKDVKGSEDNAVSFEVMVSWKTNTGIAYQYFVYNADQVGKVSGKEGTNYDFLFTLTDYAELEELSITAVVITESGVRVAGTSHEITIN